MKEEQFLNNLHAKQVGAFRELFGKFYPALVHFSLSYVQQQHVAEDIVQELFITIWKRDTRYTSYNGFKTFLYNSVRNASINYLKRRDVELRRMASMELPLKDDPEELDFKIMEEELYRLLFVVVDELPPRSREIFLLHLEGKSNDQIARQLGLSVLTVKTQKKRAMHYLKSQLGGLYFVLLALGCRLA